MKSITVFAATSLVLSCVALANTMYVPVGAVDIRGYIVTLQYNFKLTSNPFFD